MFRLFIRPLMPASFFADFSVICRLYICIFRDYLDVPQDLHLNGYAVHTKGNVKKLPPSLLLLHQLTILSFPHTQLSERVPVIKMLYYATKYLIYNVYSSAKVEAWLYSQGKITTPTNTEINSQAKM